MYSVITVADEMLKIAKAQGRKLTPLQLMKLVYIAHGWSLGLRNVDLFDDRIEAWKYGPVIPDLYRVTKHFGRSEIPFDKITDAPSGVSEEDSAFLSDVFSKYGHMSGIQLSNLTHKSGTPWAQVYERDVFGIEIKDDLIKKHYTELAHARQTNTTT